MTTGLSCQVLGFGAWGEGFENWPDLESLILNTDTDAPLNTNASKGPKPDIIPANERRRAPLPVRLAVESSWQATQSAGIDPKALSCVFVSGFGDTQLTDYMCKVLASENKELSPTKFHNSVHNAAAGYWTISTGCEKAANSVAGFQESVSLTLLEAMIQCQQEQKPILITFFDAPVSDVLKDIIGQGNAFSFSIILAPNENRTELAYNSSASKHSSGLVLNAELVQSQSIWPPLNTVHESLNFSYCRNPAARVLSLIELLLGVGAKQRLLPLGQELSLNVFKG